MAEPRDALVAALADRVMRRSLVVLAGGSFATRHRLLRDALEGLVFQDGPQGAAYRSERRAVRVVEVDLRREPWAALDGARTRSTDGARVVVLIEEAQRVGRWPEEDRACLGVALDALAEEGGACCVLLAVEGDAAPTLAALPTMGARVEGALIVLPPPWARRVAAGVGLVAALAGAVTAAGGVHDRQEIARRATMARAAAQSTHRAVLAEMTLLQGFSQRRALAAAAAALELDEIDGAAEGVDALVHDRGLMRAEGPWVLRAEPRAAWTVRYLDDRALFVAGEGYARVIEARSGRVLREFPCEGGRTVPALSWDHRVLAAPCADGVRVWDVATGRLRRTLTTGTGGDAVVSLDADASRVTVRVGEVVRGFDIERGGAVTPSDTRRDPWPSMRPDARCRAIRDPMVARRSSVLAFCDGGMRYALVGPDGGEILDLREYTPIDQIFSEDGGRVTLVDPLGTFVVDLDRRTSVAALPQTRNIGTDERGSVTIAGIANPSGVALWDVDAERLRAALDLGPQERRLNLSRSPDGARVAHVAMGGAVVHVWTLPPSRHQGAARAPIDPRATEDRAEFSGDGRVARFRDGTVQVFELGTNRRLATIAPARRERFVSARFEEGGRALITRSTLGWYDRWDLSPDDPRALLREHLARTNLRVCRDGLLVVTVPPPLDAVTATSPWAPDALCASAPRSPRAAAGVVH